MMKEIPSSKNTMRALDQPHLLMTTVLLLALLSSHVAAFSSLLSSTHHERTKTKTTSLNYHTSRTYSPYNPFRGHYNQNHHHKIAASTPLELSVEDVTRLEECSIECSIDSDDDSATKVIPLILLDALLPNQRLFFSSSDPKFESLLKYLHTQPCAEVGILGFANDGTVLNTGVVASLCLNSVNYGSKQGQPLIATSFKGSSRVFEIHHEPSMDATHSFYLASVETTSVNELSLTEYYNMEKHHLAEQLFASIPELVQEWKYWMLQTKWASPSTLERHYQWKEVCVSTNELLQQSMSERSVWVASLLNPVGMRPLLPLESLVEDPQWHYTVSAIKRRTFTPTPHIRSQILECRNDYRRLAMAVSALKQSIEFLKECDRRNGRRR